LGSISWFSSSLNLPIYLISHLLGNPHTPSPSFFFCEPSDFADALSLAPGGFVISWPYLGVCLQLCRLVTRVPWRRPRGRPCPEQWRLGAPKRSVGVSHHHQLRRIVQLGNVRRLGRRVHVPENVLRQCLRNSGGFVNTLG
jgi:hypothetical protein